MKILMYGQFLPPVTGEGIVNEKVFEILSNNKSYHVIKVNSSIIDSANSVGKFKFSKLVKLLHVFIRLLKNLAGVDILYITPGQTLPGLLRVLPVLVVARLFRCRIIAHWHGYGVYFCYRAHRIVTNMVFNLIDENILLTNDLANKLRDVGARTKGIHVVPNYVDRLYAGDQYIPVNKVFSVLYLSSLMPEKGIDSFLSAASKLPYINFIICGTGSESLVDKVTHHVLNYQNISYRGLVAGKEKYDILQEASVFVLQTSYATEGVPLSLLEAMSHGCAIVTTMHNGIPEVLGEAGIYIEKIGDQGLIEKLIFLANNQSDLEYYSNAALSRSSEYKIEKFVHSMLSIFNKNEEG